MVPEYPTPYHVGTSFHPGKGPTSIFQPVGAAGSRTARTFVSECSFAISCSRGSALSGGFESLSPGQREVP